MKKNMSLASEIIQEQQKEIIDLADLFKKARTIAPDDTLLELEKEWSEVKTPVGRSALKFIKEERERRKADKE